MTIRSLLESVAFLTAVLLALRLFLVRLTLWWVGEERRRRRGGCDHVGLRAIRTL